MANAGYKTGSILVIIWSLCETFGPYQLEVNGRGQLQISINNSRIIQTEHHRVEDSFIYEVQTFSINKDV